MLYYNYGLFYTETISKEDRAINEYNKLEQRWIAKESNKTSISMMLLQLLRR